MKIIIPARFSDQTVVAEAKFDKISWDHHRRIELEGEGESIVNSIVRIRNVDGVMVGEGMPLIGGQTNSNAFVEREGD